jgi:cobalamin synthase
MLIALLGVDLIVVAALAAFVFTRKRWVKRQLGAFRGAIAGAAVRAPSTPVAVAASREH